MMLVLMSSARRSCCCDVGVRIHLACVCSVYGFMVHTYAQCLLKKTKKSKGFYAYKTKELVQFLK